MTGSGGVAVLFVRAELEGETWLLAGIRITILLVATYIASLPWQIVYLFADTGEVATFRAATDGSGARQVLSIAAALFLFGPWPCSTLPLS